MKKLLLIISVALFGSLYTFGQGFNSKHFTIQKLADGVFAAVSKNGGYAICNAGIVDIGDATVIFDPFMTPEAAEDLKKAALLLTGSPVKYVVNSHFHNDHIGGNQVFDKASVVSTERTRDLIAKFQPEEIAVDKASAPIRLQKIKEKNTSTMSAHELDENVMWMGYYEALVTSNDSLRAIVPDVTFVNELILHGSKRTVKLLSQGEGHSESDLFLYLPVEQIAFLGDLLFIENQPWLGDGDPIKWRNYLDTIVGLGVKTFVPGHGPVGGVSSIDTMKLYFDHVNNTATNYFKKGELPQKDLTIKTPPPFQNWFLSSFYKPNIISEYNRMYKK